jgi:hypothetical protein
MGGTDRITALDALCAIANGGFEACERVLWEGCRGLFIANMFQMIRSTTMRWHGTTTESWVLVGKKGGGVAEGHAPRWPQHSVWVFIGQGSSVRVDFEYHPPGRVLLLDNIMQVVC